MLDGLFSVTFIHAGCELFWAWSPPTLLERQQLSPDTAQHFQKLSSGLVPDRDHCDELVLSRNRKIMVTKSRQKKRNVAKTLQSAGFENTLLSNSLLTTMLQPCFQTFYIHRGLPGFKTGFPFLEGTKEKKENNISGLRMLLIFNSRMYMPLKWT